MQLIAILGAKWTFGICMNIDTTYNICIIERWVNQSQQLIRCRKNLNFKGDAIETCCAISKGLAHIIFELHEPAAFM